MPGVWIEQVVNNSNVTWNLSSVDSEHNGGLYQGSSKKIELDGGGQHAIAPGQKYSAQWCGVPWDSNGNHYKRASKGGPGVKFFMAQQDGKNWVLFEDFNSLKFVARVEVSMNADSHVNLRFENDGVYLDVVDAPGSSGATQVFNEVGPWVEAVAGGIAAAIAIFA